MGAHSVAWAMKHPVRTPLERLVLMLIADCTEDEGWGRVDLARLAGTAVCDPLALSDVLIDLQERGLVSLEGFEAAAGEAFEFCLVPLWREAGSQSKPSVRAGKRPRS